MTQDLEWGVPSHLLNWLPKESILWHEMQTSAPTYFALVPVRANNTEPKRQKAKESPKIALNLIYPPSIGQAQGLPHS